MKKPVLIWVSALVLLASATLLFAQTTTGSSLITQMKAATHAFTLTADLNSGATGLESSPLVGKRTGDMLSAGEYNRILELVGQGGGGGGNLNTQVVSESCSAWRSSSCTATCPTGTVIVGGGVVWVATDGTCHISQSKSSGNGWTWSLSATNTSTNSCTAKVEAICASGGGGGGGGTGGGGFNWDACTPEWVGTPKNGTPYTNAAGLKCKYTGASGPGALDSTYYLCCPGS